MNSLNILHCIILRAIHISDLEMIWDDQIKDHNHGLHCWLRAKDLRTGVTWFVISRNFMVYIGKRDVFSHISWFLNFQLYKHREKKKLYCLDNPHTHLSLLLHTENVILLMILLCTWPLHKRNLPRMHAKHQGVIIFFGRGPKFTKVNVTEIMIPYIGNKKFWLPIFWSSDILWTPYEIFLSKG